MNSDSVKSQHQMVQALIVSVIYAAVLEASNRLLEISVLEGVKVDVAIIVPVIAAIIFGKNVGAASAAGGKVFNVAGTSLLSGGAGLSIIDPVNLIPILADTFGVYIVGTLTKLPEGKWDDFKTRFSSLSTWKRLGENTLGGLVGLGLGTSLVRSLTVVFEGGVMTSLNAELELIARQFIANFFLNSIIVVIFIPLALILYEIGDVLVQMRSYSLDKKLRNILYLTPEEKAVSIISVDLPQRAFSSNIWTPVRVRFRNRLDRPARFYIEAIANARMTPPIDKTKVLEPGEVWEQNFFVLPKKQKSITVNVRITPFLEKITESADELEDVEETILEITGRSYDPNDAKMTYLVFSVTNFAIIGASVVLDRFRDLLNNIDSILLSFQNSWSTIALVGLIESIVFGLGVGMYWFYVNKFKVEFRKNLSFATDFNTARYLNEATNRFKTVLDHFKRRMSALITTAIIFTITISIAVLGVEGYRLLTEPNYQVQYADQLIVIALVVFVSWIFGLQGQTLLREAGLVSAPSMEIEDDGPITDVDVGSAFLEGIPSTCILTIRNPTPRHGVRIEFISEDVVSPSLLEVNVPPHHEIKKNIILVPSGIGKRSILVLSYPLFDEDGTIMSRKEAEPYAHQRLNFDVVPSSQLGLTTEQQGLVKKLLVVVAIIASLVYGSDVILQRFITDLSIITFLRENLTFLLALQAPFVYAYFFVKNKLRIDFLDMDDLLDKLSATDTLAENLDRTVGSSMEKRVPTFIQEQLSTQLKANLNSLIGEDIMDELSKKIEEQCKTLVQGELREQLMKLVQASVASIIQQQLTQGVNVEDGTSSPNAIIETIINDALQEKPEMKSLLSEYHGVADPEEKARIRTSLKTAVKAELRRQLGPKAKNLIRSRFLEQEKERVKSMLTKNLQRSFKDEFISGLRDKIRAELESEIEGGLVDQIVQQVEARISDELKRELNERLEEKFNNRQLLTRLAREIDEKTGNDFGQQLEDAIGTAMESEVTNAIKDEFLKDIERQLETRFKEHLRKQIKNHLRKFSGKALDELFDNLLVPQVDQFLSQSETWLQEETLDQMIDVALDQLVNEGLDAIFS